MLSPERIPWDNSDSIPRASSRSKAASPQSRAWQALELSLHISSMGYHVYLSGENDLGRTYMLREFLGPRARKMPQPPDLLYVNNFADPDCPRLLRLPAGQGKKLKKAMTELLSRLRREFPSRFETDSYVKQRTGLLERFQEARSRLLHKMDTLAGDQGFNMDVDDNGGLMLYPMIEGKRLDEEDFEKLDARLRQELKRKGDMLLHAMAGFMRQLSRKEQSFKADERSLEQEVMRQLLEELLTPLEERTLKHCASDPLRDWFQALRKDMLEHLEAFLPRETAPFSLTSPLDSAHAAPMPPEPDSCRYDVNLFVDNSESNGAPIIAEDHPTAAKLLGCVEREAEMGALVTDFTLIKAGALHRANGGFLVLHMEDILQYPAAWEGLMRALRANSARIEESGEALDASSRSKGIEPEALPLQLKVILIGNEEMYEHLLLNDDRFSKLFKIKAHMTDATDRNAAGVRLYLSRIACIIDEEKLLTFDRAALAWLVDFGSRITEDQRKLSLKFPLLREIMIEASALAAMRNHSIVTGSLLEDAFEARTRRANLLQQLYMEDYDRELIKVRTSGSAVGRVNGLSVSGQGDFEFGLPHQISCTVGVGHGGIIDLEREAELGGPIHTKAMMILKSYLVDQFARKMPIVLTGSICFEQSYAGIEGDSASGAELAALLSAIAEVPVRLDLAFTGALSQSGQIMAVGGVTHKIEGFFSVCERQGLTGTQGVILPHDNVDQLMLPPRIIHAVDDGKFFIYPVKTIEEALELLTAMPAGKRRKDGSFRKGTLYHLVSQRLRELGRYADGDHRK